MNHLHLALIILFLVAAAALHFGLGSASHHDEDFQ